MSEQRRGYIARSGSSTWRTPVEVLELVRELWLEGISLDPCASSDPSHHFAATNITLPDDGLSARWGGRVFVNPPFGALAAWTEACDLAHRRDGAEVVLLLPARTDTAYWQRHIERADAICLWRGRMRFVGASASAPFPTALAYWGRAPWDFYRVFRERGMVVSP